MRRRRTAGGGGHGEEDVPWASFADALTGLLFVFILLTVKFVVDAQKAKADAQKAKADSLQAEQKHQVELERLLRLKQRAEDIQRGFVDKQGAVESSVTRCLADRFEAASGARLVPEGDAASGRISLYYTSEGQTVEWFGTGSAELDAEKALASCEIGRCLAGAMQSLKAKNEHDKHLVQVFVEGHTDSIPTRANEGFPSNWELSGARAAAVLRAFMPSYGDTSQLGAPTSCSPVEHSALLEFVELGQLEVVAVGRADQDPAWLRICDVQGMGSEGPCSCRKQQAEKDRASCLRTNNMGPQSLIEWSNKGDKDDDSRRRHMRRVDLRFEVRPTVDATPPSP